MPTEAATLRRWATECAAKADDPKMTPEERERLLKMREALLAVAKTQDWIDGRKTPPVQQQQQTQGRRKASRALARRSHTELKRHCCGRRGPQVARVLGYFV